MSDEKNKKPDVTDANDFESVETVTEVEVIEPVDEEKVDAPDAEMVGEDDLVMNADLVMDADEDAVDISSADGGTDKNIIDEDAVSVEAMPELDDFDDLEDELAAVSVSSATNKSSGGAGKIVVGLIAILAAGAGGYYYFSSQGASSDISQIAAPVVLNEPVVETVDVVTPAPEVNSELMQEPESEEISSELDAAPVVDDVEELSFGDMSGDDVSVEMVDDEIQDDQGMLSVSVDDVSDVNASEVMDVNEEGRVDAPDEVLVMDAEDIEPAPMIDEDVEVISVDETPSYPAETTVLSGVAPSDVPSDMKAVEGDPAVIVVEEEPAVEVSDELTVSPSEEVLLDISGEESFDEVAVPVKPDVYFDSVENVIQRDSSLQSAGPSEVDPIAEPASKYLVVTDVKPKNSMESQVQQARRALKLGRYDAAYDFYERLYQKNPKDEAVLMGRAVSLQKLGRETAAIGAYEELLNLHPKNADALVNMLGLVKGQYPAVALQKLLSIRQDHPQNAGVAAQIGLTYASMNNFEDARRYLNIAMGIEPENAQHLYNVAVVFDREGSRDKAVEYYGKALRVDAVHGGGRSINREVIYDRLAKLR